MILISPYAKQLRNGKNNPKNYPYWNDVITNLGERVVQVGVDGEERLVNDCRFNLPLNELKQLIAECRTWIGVDSFFQHLCWDQNKPGIVLWGPSDPNIYGHKENYNLLKDTKYLVSNQFAMWETVPYLAERFVSHDIVLDCIKNFYK